MKHFQRHLFHPPLSTSGPGQDQAASEIFVEMISLVYNMNVCNKCLQSSYIEIANIQIMIIFGNCLPYNVLSGRRPTRVQVNAWYREVHRCCRKCHWTLERTVAFCLQVVINCMCSSSPSRFVSMSRIVFILLKAIVAQDGSWCWYLLLLSALDALAAGGKETHHSSGDTNQIIEMLILF